LKTYPNPFDDLEGWLKQFDLFDREESQKKKEKNKKNLFISV